MTKYTTYNSLKHGDVSMNQKMKIGVLCIFHLKFFSFFCHILFFLQKLNKKKISLSFIYPPPIFLKNLSDNKDILYLFFSINMCKNILMKKMYLCLLNIRHTKKKRRKKSLPFTLPPSWTLSFGRLWASMNVDAFEKEKTKIHDAFQLLIERPKVWRTWIRENIAASPYYVL